VRTILASKRNRVTKHSRQLHNEELHVLCPSPNIIQVIKSRTRTGHVARMENSRNAHRIVEEKPEGRPLGIPRHK
jgi:hypothetical protein